MFAVRALKTTEFPQAADLMTRAYGGGSFLERITLQHALEPQGCLGIWSGPELLGTVQYVVYGPYAVIGLVATEPGAQGRGVARAGMDFVLGTLEQRGIETTVLDASALGKPLYDTLGFLERGTSYRYKLRDGLLAGRFGEAPRAPRVRHAQPKDLSWMLELDFQAMGADRSRLLQALFAQAGVRVGVLEGRGFAFVCGTQIGPLIARGPQAARALLEAVLTLEFASAPEVCVPAQNPQVCTLLEEQGFERQKVLTYMERGPARAADSSLRWAMTSFALG